MSVDLDKLNTEQRNEKAANLDKMTPIEIVQLMNEQDCTITDAVKASLEEIAKTIAAAEQSLKEGGRIFYVGAGTSGRLGVLDASECPPTFGVSPDMFVAIMAGGSRAIYEAVEGAEDDTSQAVYDLKEKSLNKKDMLIGLSASGRTPYVKSALEYAVSIGCRTASIACVAESEIGKVAAIAIEVITGAEVLTGSTRLRAGTAQKMVLNMISTGTMVRMGKVYGNLMVDLKPTNEKLKSRCIRIFKEATGLDDNAAIHYIEAYDGNLRQAIMAANDLKNYVDSDKQENACEKVMEDKTLR